MKEIINRADADGDGFIDIAEWQTIAISRRKILSDEQLRWAFNYFDQDGCGIISLDHFKRVLKIPDDQFDTVYWSNLIKEVDKDWEVTINFEQFKKMMA